MPCHILCSCPSLIPAFLPAHSSCPHILRPITEPLASTPPLLKLRPYDPRAKGNPVRGLEPTAQRILEEYVFHGLSTHFLLEARGSNSKNYETTLTKMNHHKTPEHVLCNGTRTP